MKRNETLHGWPLSILPVRKSEWPLLTFWIFVFLSQATKRKVCFCFDHTITIVISGWCNRWKRFRNVLWEGERSHWGDCCQSVWRWQRRLAIKNRQEWMEWPFVSGPQYGFQKGTFCVEKSDKWLLEMENIVCYMGEMGCFYQFFPLFFS